MSISWSPSRLALNWHKHIATKLEDVKLKVQSMSWLLRANNGISLTSKQLPYTTVIRSAWSYAAPVLKCAAKSTIKFLEPTQSIIRWKMMRASWYIINHQIQCDLDIDLDKQVIHELVMAYDRRQHKLPVFWHCRFSKNHRYRLELRAQVC